MLNRHPQFLKIHCRRGGRSRRRKSHLTQSLVASEGWSSVRDRINRKHCPSHRIWSYKRDGRWWGWSFDRGSTILSLWLNVRRVPCGHPLWWMCVCVSYIPRCKTQFAVISLSACVYLYKCLLYSWQPRLFPPKYISKQEKRCCHFFCVVPGSFSAQNVQKHEHSKKNLILITSKVKKDSKNPR